MNRALLALLLTFTACAVNAQVSQTEYNFLRLPVSAHAAALGGDIISLTENDASVIFHNPALLTSVSDNTVGLNFMNYMSGANTASATWCRTVRERAAWAVSAQYMNYGKMKEVDENNVITGDFSAKDISLAGYFSYMLTDKIAGGVTVKCISSYIGDYSSLAMGVDLGLNYHDVEKGWSVSAVVKNLGGQLDPYDDEYEKMPIDLQVGASKRLIGTPLRFSASLVDLNHTGYKFINHWVLGLDVLLSETMWVGMGYNLRRANEMKIANGEEESSHGAGLSFGAGINLDRLHINAAYGKYHVSSSSVLINLSYTL